MNLKNSKSGFTLLEIIIVIIIVGVLASLALPKFFSSVEYSKVGEAEHALGALRNAMEIHYNTVGGTYAGSLLTNLSVEDPNNNAAARFSYVLSGQNASIYVITATRKTIDGGDGTSTVVFSSNLGNITKSGTGKFIAFK